MWTISNFTQKTNFIWKHSLRHVTVFLFRYGVCLHRWVWIDWNMGFMCVEIIYGNSCKLLGCWFIRKVKRKIITPTITARTRPQWPNIRPWNFLNLWLVVNFVFVKMLLQMFSKGTQICKKAYTGLRVFLLGIPQEIDFCESAW